MRTVQSVYPSREGTEPGDLITGPGTGHCMRVDNPELKAETKHKQVTILNCRPKYKRTDCSYTYHVTK